MKLGNEGTHLRWQIINDKASSLMLIFKVTPNGESRLRLLGSPLPFGSRDFQCNKNGELAGTGTGYQLYLAI